MNLAEKKTVLSECACCVNLVMSTWYKMVKTALLSSHSSWGSYRPTKVRRSTWQHSCEIEPMWADLCSKHLLLKITVKVNWIFNLTLENVTPCTSFNVPNFDGIDLWCQSQRSALQCSHNYCTFRESKTIAYFAIYVCRVRLM